jgi:DNA-binding protein H-NS
MAGTASLHSMSIDKLLKLREQVDAAITAKTSETRLMLESQLKKLSGYGHAPMHNRRGSLRGRTVAPKYRNPENPTETWAGRGLKPRWLSAALKTGKSLEDFSIDSPQKRGPKMMRNIKSKTRIKKARSLRATARSVTAAAPA